MKKITVPEDVLRDLTRPGGFGDALLEAARQIAGTPMDKHTITDFEGRDITFLLDPLADQPDGTVEEVGRGIWLVKGRTDAYRVDAKKGVCSCPRHYYRMVPGEDCRHLGMLRKHFEAEGLMPCPFCGDKGVSACNWCADRGVLTREEYEAAQQYRGEQQPTVAMTDAELREIFR